MAKIVFQGSFWNALRLQIFEPGQEIVVPGDEIRFKVVSGTMRVLQVGTRNVLFFTNQNSNGMPVGTGVVQIRFSNFLSRHIHFTVAGSDPGSVTPLMVAFNYSVNSNVVFTGRSIPDNQGTPGRYRAIHDIRMPVNRAALANVAFLTDKAENQLEEFTYETTLVAGASLGRLARLLG